MKSESSVYDIELKNVSKSYAGKTKAVDNLSFTVEKGSTYALLGPNGAGKSTTISILTAITSCTSGTAWVNGYDVAKDPKRVRSSIGVTFQELIIDEELSGYQVLDYHARLYGFKKSERKKKIITMLELVDLRNDMHRKCKEYSGGMKRKLELVRSLLTEPEVLFLDEPTLGLDPIGRAKIWDYITVLKEKNNTTILLTTHYLDEAHKLADTVGILNEGHLAVEGTANRLIDELGSDIVTLKGSGYTGQLEKDIITLPYCQSITRNDNTIQIGIESSSKHLAEVVTIATKNNYKINDISVSKPDLGAVFLKYTGQNFQGK